MRIEKDVYRCNGCGATSSPETKDWRTFNLRLGDGVCLALPGMDSEDYCVKCVGRMRAAAVRLANWDQTRAALDNSPFWNTEKLP